VFCLAKITECWICLLRGEGKVYDQTRRVQPVVRNLKCCGPRNGPGFNASIVVFKGYWKSFVGGPRVVLPAELTTCSCGPWTNLVICIWPGSAVLLHIPGLEEHFSAFAPAPPIYTPIFAYNGPAVRKAAVCRFTTCWKSKGDPLLSTFY